MDKPALRLACLGKSAVATALLLAAVTATCEAPGRMSGTQGTVASLVVTPEIVTLSPGQMQDFTAVGFTATGDTALIAINWTATGGIVDTNSSGRLHYAHYHSASCGAFRLVATSSPGHLSDSATITVVCPAVVASIVVTPASATVSVGQTVQLTATPEDSSGNPLSGRVVTWSSGDTTIAKVNGSGLVSGVAMGSTSITATSEGKSGAATLTVTNVPVASVA
ncbi:MAG TPA: Ig-like domain-containing protein, partial [Gemmatimonadales bacterium]|nr:Ig-like domain-containing protein [Gemmatimonadales bacterium]